MASAPDDPIAQEISALQRPLAGRRAMSWLLAIATLLWCLVLPVAASVWPSLFDFAGAKKAAPAAAVVSGRPAAPLAAPGLDTRWNTGPMAAAHQPWAQDCKVCHSTPFVRAKDSDCLACHRDVGEHVKDKALSAALPALHETRCATCHRDHQGEFGLIEQNKRYTGSNCASCHADIGHSMPRTKIGNASDFGTAHPAFRVQLAQPGGALLRVRQGGAAALSEATGLKFPHDAHLAKAGIAGPKGKVNLDCADCHVPNADASGFRPVTMKDNCQSCHALAFEPAVSNRQVPHGAPGEVLSTLREFYSYVGGSRIPLDAGRQSGPVFTVRPGAPQHAAASFVNGPGDARLRAAAAATELFEKTSCIVCHAVSRLAGPGQAGTPGADLPQWKIAPVAPRHAWLPQAAFDHAKHGSAKCADCHAAATSAKAADVLMPAIETCRDCHVGKQPKVNKVASDCGLCHGFHLPSQHAAAPAAKVQP